MDIKDYISSGILELYVFDQLTAEQRGEVDAMAQKHSEVREELLAISKAAGQYAILQGVKAPADVKGRLIEQLKNEKKSSSGQPSEKLSGGWNNWHTILTALLGLSIAFYFYESSKWQQQKIQWEKNQILCDSIQQRNQSQYALIQDLSNDNIKITAIAATPKFKDVVMHLHTSKEDKLNYLQLNNLPPIQSDQAYQLWALRDGQAPMPLTVFGNEDPFVKVDFIDNVTTYAITIERKGGAQTPNLDQLIGTFGI